jgi:hypothetical protein
MTAQDYQAMIEAISDEDFPLMLRMQLESADFADLPGALQAALAERAARLAIHIDIPSSSVAVVQSLPT